MNKATIAAAIALALMTGQALSSPGNDGCVGNCSGGSTGGSTDISNVNRNNNTNLLSAGASAGASSASSSTGVGIGVGGEGGSARSTAFGGEGGAGGAALSGATSSNNLTINTPAKTMSQNYSESKSSSEFRGEYRYEYEARIHNTPSMAIGVPEASADCYVGVGGSVSAAGIGIAGATSVFSPGCEEREFIRLGQTDGDPEVRGLASRLNKLHLQEYVDAREKELAAKEEKAARVATGGTSTTNGGVFALTNY